MSKTYYYDKPNTINAFNEKVDASKKIHVLSLFSGCGGMDLGFEGGLNTSDNFMRKIHLMLFSQMIFLKKQLIVMRLILIRKLNVEVSLT